MRSRRTAARRTRSGRSAAVQAARAGNKVVASKLRKPKARARTRVGRNTMSIVALSKQVRSLQTAQFGPLQSRYETVGGPGSTPLEPSNEEPLLFAINDFARAPLNATQAHTGATIWHIDMTNHAPAGHGVNMYLGGVVPKAYWETFSPTADLETYPNQMNYWFQDQLDVIEYTKGYSPRYTEITMNFECPSLHVDQTFWFRVDFFKQRNVKTPSHIDQLQLPDNLIGLKEMVNDDMLQRNKFNPAHFKMIKTKFVKMSHSSTVSKTVEKWCKFRFPFKCDRYGSRPEEKCRVGEHMSVGSKNASGAYVETSRYTQFHEAMKPTDIIWCLISCSQPEVSGNCRVQLARTIKWRDPTDN